METRQERLAKRAQENTIKTGQTIDGINDSVDEEAIAKRREQAAFIRQVSQKRSQKYMELMGERMSIELQIEELRQKLQLDLDTKQSGSDLGPILDGNHPNDCPPSLQSLLKDTGTAQDELGVTLDSILNQKLDLSQVKATTHYKDPVIDRQKIKNQIKELDEKLNEVNSKLLEEFPVGSRMLTLVYDAQFEKKLIEKKVISCQGVPFSTPQEQAVALRDFTKEEQDAIHWGYDRFMEKGMQNSLPMFAEIYLELCCVVYADGEVEVIRR